VLQPCNETARNLLLRLEAAGLRERATPGLDGIGSYCIGVRATNAIEVFELGRTLGADFGKVRVESYAEGHIIAFPEALVKLDHGSA
jgi:hypothetical protein